MFKKTRLLWKIIRETGADAIMGSFLALFLLSALAILLTEPDIQSYGESVWYCFTVISTIGFGDVVVHTTAARVFSIILSFYSVFVVAIMTAVVVNYFNETMELRQRDSLTAISDKLEHLHELSREELKDLSARIRRKR